MSELRGRKFVVLLANLYDEKEFWYPYYRLKEAGAEVIVDGNLVSSRTPDDMPEFSRAMIAVAAKQ